MSQPPDKYERIFDFTDFSAMQPSAQQPGQKIDQELNLARESVNDTIDRLNEIQRDDGKIRSTALDTTEFSNIVNAATATATAAATSASTSATTATTQAGIATTAATNAGNSATSASGSASTATAQAVIANAATVTATTKAAEAADSAANALTSKNSAFSSASSANTSSAAAEGFSISASTSATMAGNSVTDATTQAGLASASAVAAGNSATAANGSAIAASNSAISASASAVSAAASAATINPATYLTVSTAASTYAPIAAGQPTSGTVGQILTKQSGANYDSSWATLIPGDRYLTSSTTSHVINNNNKTFTVATGLSYSSQQDIVISYDASNHMHARVIAYNPSTGQLDVDVLSHTGSGTYAAWVINVGGTPALASVVWGDILGTLGNQGDLATALSNKLETSTAASTYYPLSGNPSAFLVAADITGKANLASPSFTGNVTINSSTGAALFIEQTGTGNILTLHDQATDTTFVAIDANGKVNTIASEATNGAGFNVPHGVVPTTPVNGDIWTTTNGLFLRQNSVTRQFVDFDGTQTINGNKTFSNATQTLGNSTAASTINIGTGATLTATTKAVNIGTNGVSGSTTNITVGPVLGASTTSIGGTTAASTLNLATGATLSSLTKTLNIGTGSTLGSTFINIGSSTNSLTTVDGNLTATSGQIVIGNSTGGASINLGTGATLSGSTKAVNIGSQGLAGSTTNIRIGSNAGTSTITLDGTTNGVTLAADTNSVALATTAFVVGQAGSATPLVDGTAAVGTSLRYARQDHVHPTDTTRAPLASPTFTGTPSLPTGTTAVTQTVGNNTTAVATTAFVLANAGSTSFATSTQSRAATSTTVAQNPSTSLWQAMSPGMVDINRNNLTYTATGTMGTSGGGFLTGRMAMGTAGAASATFRTFGASAIDQNWALMSKGYRSYIDFSKFTWCSGRFYMESAPVDPLVTAAFYYGKANNSANGDLARKGFGWKLTGNATAGLRNPVLQVHNGTTLTNVTSSFAAVAQVYWDWDIISLGDGNVTLYINGTQVATTSAGPTGDTSYSGTGPVIWNEEFVSTGVTAGYDAVFGRGRIYMAP